MAKAVKANTDNLDKLIKALKQDYTLRVGIIGSKATAVQHEESSLTNAEIGTFHEFGTSKMARRSFLEDSLKFKISSDDAEWRNIKKDAWKQMFNKFKPQEFLQDLGAKCLLYIEEGFETNGFGMWKPLSESLFSKRLEKAMKAYNRAERSMERDVTKYDKQKLNNLFDEVQNPRILTDTGKMRHSISFKVFKNK